MEISVVIPAYNRENLIAETLYSLLQQTHAAAEIIVVDDGSTDRTADAASDAFQRWSAACSVAESQPEFRVIRQENAGLGPARNRGIQEARGEFVHIFDSDDIAMPTKHAVQLAALRKSGADIVISPWARFEHVNGTSQLDDFVLQDQLPYSNHPFVYWWIRNWSILLQSMLIRRSLLQRVGSLGSDMPSHQDEAYFTRVLAAHAKIAFSGGIQLLYRLHDSGNLTARTVGPVANRTIDRANFLLGRGETFERQMTFSDKLIHGIHLKRCFKDFQTLGMHNDPTAEHVKKELSRLPSWLLTIVCGLDRVATRLRFQQTGTRWPTALRPRRMTIDEHSTCQCVLQGLSLGHPQAVP